MSIVAAVRKQNEIVIAADTQTNFGHLKIKVENHRAIKIRRIGSAWVASTGWSIYEDILEHYITPQKTPRLSTRRDIFTFFMRFWKDLHGKYSFVNDQCHEVDDRTPFAELDAEFLIVNKKGIFHVAGNMSITEFQQYFAIGSGSDYALGALHALYEEPIPATEMARRAVAAAMYFDNACGGELELKIEKTK